MKIYYFLLFGLFIFGCQNKNSMTQKAKSINEIKYSYNGVEITRFDFYGKTEFYYSENDSLNSGFIWAEYSGINDGFKGYLKFDENGKVFLLSGDGYFQSKDIDTSKFEYKRIYADNRLNDTSNVCEIMLSTRYEKEFNSKRKTEVEFIYRTNENE